MTHSVYFARVGHYVKIGHSGNVRNRLYSIKRAKDWVPGDLDQSAPVELLRTIPGCTPDDESTIHYLLWDHNAIGEWFHATDALMSAVASLEYVPDPDRYMGYAIHRRMQRLVTLSMRRRRLAVSA